MEQAERDLRRQAFEPHAAPKQDEAAKLFKIEAFEEITFSGREEWTVKGLMPSQGLVVVYGPSGCGKSFLVTDLALLIAQGEPWAGKKVQTGSVCYVAAEGAAGFRKRIAAYREAHGLKREKLPFYLISAAPNLGTDKGDLEKLRLSIESRPKGLTLRLITIDTVSQVLHGAEENGSGMTALIANANVLAAHFKCAVLVIHHSGKNVENGARGHSSLPAAADVVWSVKKDEARGVSVVTVEKAKDEIGGLAFDVKLKRVVLAVDEDGDEISSLVVESITEVVGVKPKKAAGKPKPPPSANLLMACVREALGAHGREIRSFMDGPMVRAVAEPRIRDVYYERQADKEPNTIRTALWRGIKNAIDRQDLVAGVVDGERFIWLP
ncbi:AAA family ATPase [uncultured Rhodoblastus sp.]|uniref:AAA family ATPase n=1 Tax=uncultured Rhodoblastus sp. TaxID=543037 RepID=UPI0025D82EF8|nr:AAA family ATPase [uncultured Rhodoblastus sp.]